MCVCVCVCVSARVCVRACVCACVWTCVCVHVTHTHNIWRRWAGRRRAPPQTPSGRAPAVAAPPCGQACNIYIGGESPRVNARACVRVSMMCLFVVPISLDLVPYVGRAGVGAWVLRGGGRGIDGQSNPAQWTRVGGFSGWRGGEWPLHDIATANVAWSMAYTRGVGWGSYIAH